MARRIDKGVFELTAERWGTGLRRRRGGGSRNAAILDPAGEVLQRTGEHVPIVGEGARRQYSRLYSAMAVTDALLIATALFLAYQVRFGPGWPTREFLLVMLAALPLTLAIFLGFGLYNIHQFGPAEEFRRAVLAISVVITTIVMVSFWSKSSFSRVWIGLSWVFSLVLVLLSRHYWRSQVRKARSRGRLMFRTLIVGTNEEAERLAEVMRVDTLGFRPLGFVANGNAHGAPDGLPVLGDIARLRGLIREANADCVFVASSAVRADEVSQVSKAGRLEGVEVRVTANLPEVLSSRLALQPLGGQMVLSLRPVRLTGSQAFAKRTFDLVVSSTALILTSPLWIGIALAIKLTSRGPVLFKQVRVGQRQRPFTLLKFRTMVQGADLMVEDLRAQNEASGPLFKLREDPRVTRVGKRLRKWSLDELPQLLNVVKGEMSLVGPRPPLPREVSAYEDWQLDRLEVPPGITGLWQISGRSQLSFDEYVRLDLFYIENWSLSYDLFILAKTIPILVSRKGAY